MPQDAFTTDAFGVVELHKTELAQDVPYPMYIKVVDNVFSAQECEDLIKLGESEGTWAVAKISTVDGEVEDTEFRNNGRILRFDEEAAARIFEKLEPHLQDVAELAHDSQWATVISPPRSIKGKWEMVGLNDRLSFLKYGPGHFFQPHCDGQVALPDGRESRVTVQIYLNDESQLSGGATRIFGLKGRHLDIHPRRGRILVFQQRSILHSGEEVVEGLKYTLRTDVMYRNVQD